MKIQKNNGKNMMKKMSEKTKPSKVKPKESKAAAARKNKEVDIVNLIGEIIPEETVKPLNKYVKDVTKDYAFSFNWHLDRVINENWAYANELFSPSECDKIIHLIKDGKLSTPLNYGSTGDLNGESNFEDFSKVRISPISWIRSDNEETFWIFERMESMIIQINKDYFNYDLSEIQSLQFTAYDSEEKGFYGKHIDMMYKSNSTRKLSVSVQLSGPEDYEGGDLLLHISEPPLTLPKRRGTAIFFPSYSLHEVTPVTKGIRYSLVSWVVGPRFK